MKTSFSVLIVLLFQSCVAAADGDVAFLQTHCIDCHGPDTQEAGLRVDRLDGDLSEKSALLSKWVLIHDRVKSGEMPPQDASELSDSDRSQFVSALREQLLQAEKRREQKRGRGLVRRLNRMEYEHTLQDLLSLPLLRVKEMLPEDGQQHGFDKVPSALELSHVQMRKYLATADKALRQAIVRDVKPPPTVKWKEAASKQGTGRSAIATHNAAPLLNGRLADGLSTKVMGNPITNIGNSYRAAVFGGDSDSLVVFSGVLGAHQPQGIQPDRFRVTRSGWYRVRFSTWGLRWERGNIKPAVRSVIRKYRDFGEPVKPDPVERWKYTRLETPLVRESEENIEFYGDAEAVHVVRASLKGKVLGFFDAPSLKPTEHEFKVWLEPGERLSFHVMSLPATGPPNWGTANGVRSYDGPAVAYDWFEIEGPLIDQWPPESQRRLFGATPIGAFPRSLIDGIPTAKPDSAIEIPVGSLKGVGQQVGKQWYLNLTGKVSTRVNFASPGRYTLSVKAAETPAGDEHALMRLWHGDRPIPHGLFPVTAVRDKPAAYGKHFEVTNSGPAEIGIEFRNDFFDDATKADRNLLISGMTITGPKPRAAAETPAIPDIGTLLRAFADRAFRRPVEPYEIAPYRAIVDQQLAAGESFEEAMIAGYKAVLCSPDFLFVGLESSDTSNANFALASRLSYFLWNSMPDDELRRLAESGSLSQPQTLIKQVERMLSDSRSDRFVEHFLDQWLEMKDIDFTTPDPQLYPEFDPWLRDSMLAETRACFRKLIAENRSIDHVIDSDFVLVNQRLAELYGIRGVTGSTLREVALSDDSPRGGFLTQAAVLKVTANGTATSPVLRGVWVTERIQGIPRREPPPNVPAVEPDASGAVTIREQIEQHRADPACASCHKVMDPPGLALESFDVIGGWRTNYRAGGRPKMVGRGKDRMLEPHLSILTTRGDRKNIRLGGKVDPSGVLPDGRNFADLNELKALLLTDRQQLATNLARQLAIYATGKGYRFSDRDTIHTIVKAAKPTGYGIRTLINELVTSELFIQEEH